MVYVKEVTQAENFNPAEVIKDIMDSTHGKPNPTMRKKIDNIISHTEPVAPPANLKLFSNRIEEVNDMRHFLYNKFSNPVSIIHIESGYLYSDFNDEQEKLYKSDNVSDGRFPHDPGLFYAENSRDGDDTHEWVSVPNMIEHCLSVLLYWMKFAELTGINLDDYLVGLNGHYKMLYNIIKDHKEELMQNYDIIAF